MERRGQVVVPVERLSGVTRERFLSDIYPRVRPGAAPRAQPSPRAQPGCCGPTGAGWDCAEREGEERRDVSCGNPSPDRVSTCKPQASGLRVFLRSQ